MMYRQDWPRLRIASALNQMRICRKIAATVRFNRYSLRADNCRLCADWWGRDISRAKDRLRRRPRTNLAKQRALERHFPDFPF